MTDARRFWNWSLRIYARSGIAPLCLRLQDDHQLAINPLLFAVWLAVQGQAAGDDVAEARRFFDTALAEIEPWQVAILRPLRSARRALKDARRELPAQGQAQWHARYDQLLALELDCEQEVQQRLEALARRRWPVAGRGAQAAPSRVLADRHLAAVAAASGVDWTPALAALARPLVDEALRDAGPPP